MDPSNTAIIQFNYRKDYEEYLNTCQIDKVMRSVLYSHDDRKRTVKLRFETNDQAKEYIGWFAMKLYELGVDYDINIGEGTCHVRPSRRT